MIAALALALVGLVVRPGLAHADSNGVLTIVATADIHGHLFNWDYAKAEPYPDNHGSKQPLGMAHAASLIKQTKARRGAESVLVVDNGDYIQGTPLSYLAAMHPERFPSNPLARAANLVGYDVLNLGNHEFNYGLPYLNSYAQQLQAPLLGANVLNAATGKPAYTPTAMLTKRVAGRSVKIGVVGVVTTAVQKWDKDLVKNKLIFADPVKTTDEWATKLKSDGADVVVAIAHTGLDAPNKAYRENTDEVPENVATSIAAKARNIDVVISGHTHVDIPKTLVAGASGHEVLVSQPHFWARGVTEVSIPLTFTGARPTIDYSAWDAKARYSMEVDPDPDFMNDPVLKQSHQTAVDHVRTTPGLRSRGLETSELSAGRVGKVLSETFDRLLTENTSAGDPTSPAASVAALLSSEQTSSNESGQVQQTWVDDQLRTLEEGRDRARKYLNTTFSTAMRSIFGDEEG